MALAAPDKLRVATLNAKHPTYDADRDVDLWALYSGGRLFDPARFLLRRVSEPPELYAERLRRAFYIGYISEVVDFFVSNLFIAAPEVTVGKQKLTGKLDEFVRDATQGGESLHKFARERWQRTLSQSVSYTLVDLPRVTAEQKPTNRAQQETAGLLRPFVRPVNRDDLYDFDVDDHGCFSYAVIHTQRLTRPDVFDTERKLKHRWTIYDREQLAIYEAEQKLIEESGKLKPAEGFEQDEAPRVGDVQGHPFGVVPLIRLDVPDSLRIGEQLESVQRHLIELDNAIAWQMFNSLFAMPVIKSERDFKQTVGEAYFIKLDPGDEFEFAEPSGNSITVSMARRREVMEELHRISHQMAQAVTSQSNAVAQSGEAKRRDRAPEQIILEYFGELARGWYRSVLALAATARAEPSEFVVSGMDEFDVEDLGTFLDNQLKGQAIIIPSETFEKERAKRAVRKLMPDLEDELLKKIDGEVDAATIERESEDEPTGKPGGGKPAGGKPGAEK